MSQKPEPPILDYRIPHAERPAPRGPIAPLVAVFHIFCGIFLPAGCFLISVQHYPLGPEWQSGQWRAYVGLIPKAACGWPFYPFLAYSMACLAWMIWDAREAARRFTVRIGLITGVLLALQFTLIQFTCMQSPAGTVTQQALESTALSFAGVIGLAIAITLASLLIRRIGWMLVFAGGISIAIAMSVAFRRPEALGILFFGPIALAPVLAGTSYLHLLRVARRLNEEQVNKWLSQQAEITRERPSPWRYLLPIFWLGGYGIA